MSRCVVLSRGDDVSPGFLASLKRRGIEAIVIGRPIVAFAELLAAERSRPSSGGWGLPERNRTAFIVADRDRWERLDQLLNAIRAKLPNVAVWVASADLLLEVSEPVAPAVAEQALPDVPLLRLAGEGSAELLPNDPSTRPEASAELHHDDTPEIEEHADDPHEQEEEPGRTRGGSHPISAAVTAEEIEMLLKMLPPDPHSGPHPDRPDAPPPAGPGGRS